MAFTRVFLVSVLCSLPFVVQAQDLPTYTITASCGNGTIERGEECDDGNQEDNDSCRSDCTITLPPKKVKHPARVMGFVLLAAGTAILGGVAVVGPAGSEGGDGAAALALEVGILLDVASIVPFAVYWGAKRHAKQAQKTLTTSP